MATWRNWAGEQRCAPHSIERPAGEEELTEVVASAAASGLRVKAVGSGHSFTDIACTDGVMVGLDRMNRVLDADGTSGLVRLQAGATLRELGPRLGADGLALENQGDVDPQTISGAISTATHGTGAGFKNISSQVRALRIVTPDGPLAVDADSDPDAFLAARVSLGSLGVISEVTLQCVPSFTIHRVDEPRPLAEVLAGLEELVDSSDHFEFFTFPYTDRALTLTSRRTDEPPRPAGRIGSWVEDKLIYNHVFGAMNRLGRIRPRTIPAFNRFVARMMSRSEHLDLSYRVYAHERDVRFTEMEYAIPRAAVSVAVERIMDLVSRRDLSVGFPLEVRFAAPDDAFLSTAQGRETGYIAVHVFRGMEFESYFRGVEAIMNEYGGRPHWGKRHYQTAATLRPLYPGWDRFQEVRRRLDPEGVFSNEYTDRVLGHVSA
jgi:FAD-linked oxidoreductase